MLRRTTKVDYVKLKNLDRLARSARRYHLRSLMNLSMPLKSYALREPSLNFSATHKRETDLMTAEGWRE